MPAPTQAPALHGSIVTGAPPAALLTAWRALAVEAENPYALPDWHFAWLEAHPEETPVVVSCARADGSVAGVVPLVVARRRGLRRLSVAGKAMADWSGPACAEEDEPAVAAAALAALAEAPDLWDVWELDRCLLDGAWGGALRAAAPRAGCTAIVAPGRERLSLVALGSSEGLPMSGKQRRELQRLRRRLEEEHEVVFRRSEGPEQAARDVDRLLALHAERFGAERFDPATLAFLRSLTARAAEDGWLRLWVLEVDSIVVAALYGWRVAPRAFAYLQAFELAYDRYGVGVSLLAHAVKDAAAEGCATFDMLRGEERHKLRFQNAVREAESLSVVRRRSLGELEVRAWAGARAAWRRLPAERRAQLRARLRR